MQNIYEEIEELKKKIEQKENRLLINIALSAILVFINAIIH